MSEELKNRLSLILSESKSNLLRVTNIKLVTLFWEVGILLQQQEKNKKRHRNATFFVEESKSLSQIYGEYFLSSNLENMIRFATEFPPPSVQLIASFISWEEICALLTLKEWNQRWCFLNGLDEKYLNNKKGIDKSSANNCVRLKRMTAQTFFLMLQTKSRQKNTEKSFVSNLLFDLNNTKFHQFINTSKSEEWRSFSEKSELGKIILTLSELKKQEICSCLNVEINKVFWSIGMEIKSSLSKYRDRENYLKTVIQIAVKHINRMNNCSFSAKHFREIALVVEQVNNQNVLKYVSQLITWNQLIVLCSIKDIKKIILYAHVVASEGLTIRAIKKRIRQDEDVKKIYNINIDWVLDSLLRPKISEGQIRRGNNIVKYKKKSTLIVDERLNNKCINNIFENSHFHLLLPKAFLNKPKNE